MFLQSIKSVTFLKSLKNLSAKFREITIKILIIKERVEIMTFACDRLCRERSEIRKEMSANVDAILVFRLNDLLNKDCRQIYFLINIIREEESEADKHLLLSLTLSLSNFSRENPQTVLNVVQRLGEEEARAGPAADQEETRDLWGGWESARIPKDYNRPVQQQQLLTLCS